MIIPNAPGADLVVADLMTLEPVVVAADASLEEAEALMHDRVVSGLPVVDPQGELVGVISRTDVVEDGSIAMSTLLRRRPSGLRVGELMSSPAVRHWSVAPLAPHASVLKSNEHCRGLLRKPSPSVSHFAMTASFTSLAFSSASARSG